MSPDRPDPTESDATDDVDELARAVAVDEARAVFDEHWPLWARAHDRPVRPFPPCDPPRVTLVGETADAFHHLAVVRFAFEQDGLQFAGLARGPLTAPVFRIWLLADPEAGGGPRWWRRLRGGDRRPRHRASTLMP